MGIQMKRKELTKIYIMITNLKNLWSPGFIQQYFSFVRVNVKYAVDYAVDLCLYAVDPILYHGIVIVGMT